eukprot:gene10157-21172_t
MTTGTISVKDDDIPWPDSMDEMDTEDNDAMSRGSLPDEAKAMLRRQAAAILIKEINKQSEGASGTKDIYEYKAEQEEDYGKKENGRNEDERTIRFALYLRINQIFGLNEDKWCEDISMWRSFVDYMDGTIAEESDVSTIEEHSSEHEKTLMKHQYRLGIIMDGMEGETYHCAEQEEEDYDQMGLVVRQRIRRGSGNNKQLALEWLTFKRTESAGAEAEQRIQDNRSGDLGTDRNDRPCTTLMCTVGHEGNNEWLDQEIRHTINVVRAQGTTQCPDVLTRLGQLVRHQQGDRAQDPGRSDHMMALERIQQET